MPLRSVAMRVAADGSVARELAPALACLEQTI